MSKPLPWIWNTLFFLSCSLVLSAQNQKIIVSGTVADTVTGQLLADVNISIVGTSVGGTTNQTGEFSLILDRIPAVLYFSHVGYAIGSYQVEKTREKDIRILLEPVSEEIEEVSVSSGKISQVLPGDTLDIMDFEIAGNRIFLLAGVYRNSRDLRLYLTDQNGDRLDSVPIRKAGVQFKLPENLTTHDEYLWHDFTGQVHFLDKNGAHELLCYQNRIDFGYDTPYDEFISTLLPIKCEMMGRLIYQVSTQTKNYTFFFGRGQRQEDPLKCVTDKKGTHRYVLLDSGTLETRSENVFKKVPAPIFRKGNELYIFDFFENHFEVFDSELKSVRTVPINFHSTTITTLLLSHSRDVDTRNFTQSILFDEKSGKAYAFFRLRSGDSQSLREVNLKTGEISRIIEIPHLPNVTNLRVYGNTLYFLYSGKTYPYYRSLYRMSI